MTITPTPGVYKHDDVINWKQFPRYWPFVQGNHRSPVNSPHKGQWRGALMFTLLCARINSWVNNREAVDLRRHRVHYDVIVWQHTFWLYDPSLQSETFLSFVGCWWFQIHFANQRTLRVIWIFITYPYHCMEEGIICTVFDKNMVSFLRRSFS